MESCSDPSRIHCRMTGDCRPLSKPAATRPPSTKRRRSWKPFMAENQDVADLSLVLALIKVDDALKQRAHDHMRGRPRMVMPLSVGIELLVIARRDGIDPVAAVGACQAWFDVEGSDLLATASQLIVDGDARTPFDAVHLATALV